MQKCHGDTNCRKPQWCIMLKEIPYVYSQEVAETYLDILNLDDSHEFICCGNIQLFQITRLSNVYPLG